MAAISEIAFQCPNCTNWMPSAVQVADENLFESVQMFGNQAACPFCDTLVPCGKANMRWRYADGQYGGYSGEDTRGPDPSKTPRQPTPKTGTFTGQTFRGEHFLLDGSTFKNCVFKGCFLYVSGAGGGHMEGCDWRESVQPYRFVGPAATTLRFLKSLWDDGNKGLVNAIFADITGQAPGQQPPTRH